MYVDPHRQNPNGVWAEEDRLTRNFGDNLTEGEVFEHFAGVYDHLRAVNGRIDSIEHLDEAPWIRAHITAVVETLTLIDAADQEGRAHTHTFRAGGWIYHLVPYNLDGFPVFTGTAEPDSRTAAQLRQG